MLWSLDAYNETHCPYDDLWPCAHMVGPRLDGAREGFALNAKSAAHLSDPVRTTKHKHYLRVILPHRSESGANAKLVHVHEERTENRLTFADPLAYDTLLSVYEKRRLE
jgi:hypothetical protein